MKPVDEEIPIDGQLLKEESLCIRRLFQMPLRFSERRLLLVGIDLLAINCGLLLAIGLRPEYGLSLRLIIENPLWFLLINILWLPIAFAFDAYDLRVAGKFSTTITALLKAEIITTGIYLLIPFLTPALPGSRFKLFAFFLFPLVLLLAFRSLYILVLTQPFFNRRALIVGTGSTGRTIAHALNEQRDHLYHLVGLVNAETGKNPSPSEGERLDGPDSDEEKRPLLFNVLGNRHDLRGIIREHRVTSLILANSNPIDADLLQILMDCLELGVEIIPMPILYEQLTGRVPVEHIGENWYAGMPIHHPGTGGLWPPIKRAMDVFLASIGLILLAPVLPFIALAIYLESPGPIFFTQERVGKGGRVFRAYKFRSMVPDAEKGQAVWAQKNDQRVTRVGRLLRKTHVDEFPQFFNIIKGEMSAVGPRPERPEFVEELVREIPFYRVRHAVKPGMAGWGLVKQGYGASKEDALVKLQYDLYYIKHQSLWLDLVILLKTIIDTLTFRGRA